MSVADLVGAGINLTIDVDSLELSRLVVVVGGPEESVLVNAFSVRGLPADFDFFIRF